MAFKNGCRCLEMSLFIIIYLTRWPLWSIPILGGNYLLVCVLFISPGYYSYSSLMIRKPNKVLLTHFWKKVNCDNLAMIMYCQYWTFTNRQIVAFSLAKKYQHQQHPHLWAALMLVKPNEVFSFIGRKCVTELPWPTFSSPRSNSLVHTTPYYSTLDNWKISHPY